MNPALRGAVPFRQLRLILTHPVHPAASVNPAMFQKPPQKPVSITLKTPAEIEKMRVAGYLAAEVLDMFADMIKNSEWDRPQ